jgi:O-antigen/teichoic acid export membrane protein
MEEERKSYNSIFKASAIFGGVQIFQVFIQIIRAKIVALLLGPAGVGVFGLFNVTVSFVSSITNFGLGTSAIKEIAVANEQNKENKISETLYVLKKLVWFTGLLGMIISIIFSPLLSQLTFGNFDYTYTFVWLSISLLFNQLTTGKLVILQGLRKVKILAKANLLGSVFGLIIVFPLFYFFRIDGIATSIIVYSITLYFFAWYFTRTIPLQYIQINNNEVFRKGKVMLTMGFILGISGLITALSNYLTSLFIVNFGSIEQLGFYNAGIAITTNYTGLIFAAIATDYHPRLSALENDTLVKQAVNQQAEIALIILTPLILIFLVFGDFFIQILYSNDFLSIKPMICWILLGTFFKLFSWAISFTFVARGKIKLFFWNELVANIYVLIFSLIGYYYFGLIGLGFAFLVSFVIYSVQVYILARKNFEFSYESLFIKNFIIQFTISCFCYLVTMKLQPKYAYLLGMLFILFSFFYSIKELNKKINLKELIKNKKWN